MLKFIEILGAILLPLSAGALQIRVTDAQSGRPIDGATVGFQSSTNKTDASGLTAGKGSKVTAQKSGYVPMKMSWEDSSAPEQFELKLPPAETIGGRIMQSTTNPVANATITIIVPGRLAGLRPAVEDFPVTSDAEGRWRCDFLPKDPDYVKLEFAHPKFEWFEKEFSLADLRAQKAELKVTPVVNLSGGVFDSSGTPLAGAEIVLGREYGIYGGGDLEARTDAAGRFSFPRLRVEKRVLGVHAEGWAPESLTADVKPDMPEIQVRLQKGNPLRFRVQDENGNPLGRATVRLNELQGTNNARWSNYEWEWKTDGQGVFIWTNAPPSQTRWTFSKSGHMACGHYQSAASTNQEVVIKLGPPFSLTGTVIDATTGKPIPEFVLNGRYVQQHPSASPGTWYDWGRKTFRNGQFSAYYEDPLLGGASQMHDWQFRVEAEGYESALSRVIRDSERGTNIAFQLKPLAMPNMLVETPSSKKRVTTAVALQSATVSPGDTVTVFIKARIAEGHWIYALEKSGSANLPVSIQATVPRAFQAEGPWRSPAPKVHVDESRTLAGDVLFQRRYLVEGYAQPQKHKLRFKLEFQVCNDALCWPPEAIDMEADLEVVKPR